MTTNAPWKKRYQDSLMHTFAVPELILDHGDGAYVWDAEGRRYLDFLAGIAVNVLGHNHPALVGAVGDQAAKLIHVSNYFATAPQLEAAEALLRVSGAGESGRVFFANSGTEANEAAFKLARLNSTASRTRILSLTSSFHGRSMGALAMTGKASLRAPFEPMVSGVEFIDSTLEALEAAMGDDVAALICEPIKGEAGVLPLPDGFLVRARELTRQHGALLILDEIQTGVGRTGAWFAFQHTGITPDVMTLAKGLAGGVPIGAVITFGGASELFDPGQHGTTFGGNPLATAAAAAVIAEIERAGLIENAAHRGAQLADAIRAWRSPEISEVRGQGLLIGVGLTRPIAKDVLHAAQRAGVIVNAPSDTSIRLAPPLIIGDEEIDEFLPILKAAIDEAAASAPQPE